MKPIFENKLNSSSSWWKGTVTVFTSLDSEFTMVETFERVLKTTQNSVLMSIPWFGKGFVDIMRRNLRNGVEIRVLTRVPKENNDNTVNAINALYSLAVSHEWKVEVGCTSKFHPKFIVVDTCCCLAGSLNPTEAGMYYNYEMGFEIKDPIIVSKVSDFFFDMWQRSVSWEEVKQFSGYQDTVSSSRESRIAERYIGVLLNNGNKPLPKWKVARELESRYGFAEADIIRVENHLIREGKVYEPKPDYVCLTPSSD